MISKTALIGILAGMGPKSTGPFIDSLVHHFQTMTGAIHDIDFPPMMIYSLPTPFYIDRPIDHEQMKKVLIAGLKKLEDCGVSFIAIPCITVHQYFDELQKLSQVPILNMIELTLKAIPASSKKLAIIGTQSTLESRVFQNKLDQLKLPYVVETPIQLLIDGMLLEIKGQNRQEKLIAYWEQLLPILHAHHIDTILLACTDFSPFFRTIQHPFRIVDAASCLAQATAKTWIEL